MSVTLEIPADILSSVRIPPQEMEARLRLELAVALYSQNLLASGKACALAGLTRLEWENVLGKRAVPRHYGEADLAEDVSHAQRSQ
jgi:predicted HTH domain antitoxin